MFTENPDKWGRELSEKTELQLLLMNLHLQGLDNEKIDLVGEQNFAGIPRLQNISLDDRKKQLRQTIVTNTFLSLFRDVVVFIDKTLALYLMTKASQKNPIGPIENIENYFDDLPLEEYKKLSRNRKIDFPTKIELITKLTENSKTRLIEYNNIRVAFEHHGGIPKKEISLLISPIEINGEEKGMQTVKIRFDKTSTMLFPQDQLIRLKAQDVSVIGHDINVIIKDIFLALDAMDKEEI